MSPSEYVTIKWCVPSETSASRPVMNESSCSEGTGICLQNSPSCPGLRVIVPSSSENAGRCSGAGLLASPPAGLAHAMATSDIEPTKQERYIGRYYGAERQKDR